MIVMKAILGRKLVATLSVLVALVFVGCETTEVSRSNEPFVVEKGMSVEDLVEGLGEPDEVVPYGDQEGAELWVYLKERTDSNMVSTEMKEIPFIDPVTGVEGTQLQNVMSPEITISRTKTVFLVVERIVAAWKVEEKADSHR